jgi:peroxiredoxin
LAIPSTFIIDSAGVIRWKYVGRGASDRPPVDEVLKQIAAIGG